MNLAAAVAPGHVTSCTHVPVFLQPLSHLDAKILNKDGESPLHIAADMGDEHVLALLLATFVNPEKGEPVLR